MRKGILGLSILTSMLMMGCNMSAPPKDTTPPQVTVTSPAEATTVNSTSVEIKGKITDDRGKIASATYSIDGGAAQNITLAADGSFSFTVNNLTEGDHALKITAKDQAGLVREFPFTFKVVLPDLMEPNNTFDKATALTFGQTTGKAIIDGSDHDVDWYKFEGVKGQKVRIEVMTQSAYADSQLDSVVYLYPPILNEATLALAMNDDGNPASPTDMGSRLDYTLTETSTYYIKVTSFKAAEGVADNNPKNTYKVKLSLVTE